MALKKHQLQMITLGLALAVFIGVLVYAYWDKIMPIPVADETALPSVVGLQLPPFDDGLLKRSDYQSLKSFAEIGAMPAVQPGIDPFRPGPGQMK